MPINAGYEYGEAQKRVNDAKTTQEKIKALEKWQAQILLISSNEIEEDEEIISYSTIYKFRIWILNILELFKEIMVGSNG